MEHYAGIDVSLELSSVCLVDALVSFLRAPDVSIERIGLEAGRLSQWLHAGLTKAGFETVLLAGDAAREGGAIGDDGEDRPQGCARHRTTEPDRLVSAGPLQIARIAGDPGGELWQKLGGDGVRKAA